MLLVMIAIFIPTGYIGYAVIGLLVLAVALSAKLKINFLWRSNETNAVYAGISFGY